MKAERAYRILYSPRPRVVEAVVGVLARSRGERLDGGDFFADALLGSGDYYGYCSSEGLSVVLVVASRNRRRDAHWAEGVECARERMD